MDSKSFLIITSLILALLAIHNICKAQESGGIPPSQEIEQSTKNEVNQKDNAKDQRSGSSMSFSDRIFHNRRIKSGISLEVFEAYDTNPFSAGSNRQPDTFTLFYPQIFANFGRRKAEVHFDYGFGYTMYNRERQFNAAEHTGTIDANLQLSRRTSAQINEYMFATPNDIASFRVRDRTLGRAQPGWSQEVLFEGQRVFSNSLSAGLEHRLTRKSVLGVSAAYEVRRYSGSRASDGSAIEIRLGFEQQLTRWLFLQSNYQFDLYRVGDQFGNAGIQRLEIAQLRYRVRPTLSLFAAGGLDVAEYLGITSVAGSFRGGVIKHSGTTDLSLTYERGLGQATGLAALLRSHSLWVDLGQKLTRRTRLEVLASYFRSSALLGRGQLESLIGETRMEFSARRDLIFSLAYLYLTQRTQGFVQQPPNLVGQTIYAGIQYIFPSAPR